MGYDMKRLLISMLAAFIGVSAQGQSPTFQEFFSQKKTQIQYLLQQIAALKVQLGHLKEGYDIVQKGLNTVGEIREGKFSMDRTYLSSLKTVSPVVRDAPMLKKCLAFERRILTDFQSLNQECQSDEIFSETERGYVASVYANVLSACSDSMTELELVLTTGQAEMQDAERLSRLEAVQETLLELHSFSQDFIAGARALSLQRKKDADDIKLARKLYQQI
jgi:hypothetical protein